jgi:hypothetical protein
MAGDEYELAQAGARDAVADLGPGRDGGRGRYCQRSRKSKMLDRDADPLHRQKRDRKLGRQEGSHARQIGFGYVAVDAERQMRPVLLHRGKRQHGDPALHRVAGSGDLLPGHFLPVVSGQIHWVRSPTEAGCHIVMVQ